MQMIKREQRRGQPTAKKRVEQMTARRWNPSRSTFHTQGGGEGTSGYNE